MNVFIIGAGFTKAVFPDAPLNGDLLDVLAAKSTDSAASTLRDRYKTNDIEIALTRLDSEISTSQDKGVSQTDPSYKLRRRVEEELGDHFNSSSFSSSEGLFAKLPWLIQFVDGVFKTKNVVISLN